MADELDTISLRPIAIVRGGRQEIDDDQWGDVHAQLELASWVPDGVLSGLDAFSHLEVVYVFHRVDALAPVAPRRRPRGIASLPEVGALAQRHKDRFGRIGLSRCAIRSVSDRTIGVAGLDAISGTPVLDIKPWFDAFGPRGSVEEPAWVASIVSDYF